jgi:endonuclease/exonuclease/phosphatase (EEP) superfamily protein YafD
MIDFSSIGAGWIFAQVVGAVIVIGILVYVKRFFEGVSVPWWVWHVTLVPLSAMAGIATCGITFQALLGGLAVLTITQLAYKPLVKLPETWVATAGGAAASSAQTPEKAQE